MQKSQRAGKRAGKIAGLMVILLLIILIPTWAVGHWISGTYPTVADSGETTSENVSPGSDEGVDNEVDAGSGHSMGSHHSTGSHHAMGPSDSVETASDPDRDEVNVPTTDNVSSQELESMKADVAAMKMAANKSNAELVAIRQQLSSVSAERDRLNSQLKTQAELDTNRPQTASAEQVQAWNAQKEKLQSEINQQRQQIDEQSLQIASLEKQLKAANTPPAAAVAPTVAGGPGAPVPAAGVAVENPPGPTAKRAWTAITGQAVEATFVGLEGSTVLLKSKGRVFRVPLEKLAEADRAIAVELSQK